MNATAATAAMPAAIHHAHVRASISTGSRIPAASSVSGTPSPRSDSSSTVTAGRVAVTVRPSSSVAETSIAGTSAGPASQANSNTVRIEVDRGVAAGGVFASNGPYSSPIAGMRSSRAPGAVATTVMVMGAPGCQRGASSVRVTRSAPAVASCSTRAWAGRRSVARGPGGSVSGDAGRARAGAGARATASAVHAASIAMRSLTATSSPLGGGRRR